MSHILFLYSFIITWVFCLKSIVLILLKLLLESIFSESSNDCFKLFLGNLIKIPERVSISHLLDGKKYKFLIFL